MTKAEREEMARHETWISRPVKDLFPNLALRERAVCPGCGRIYGATRQDGAPKSYCTDRCRDRASKRRHVAKAPRPPDADTGTR
jgi:hypothetical protein